MLIFLRTGCALDAATRGLRTAMVELDDFASGTTSRHGMIKLQFGIIVMHKSVKIISLI